MITTILNAIVIVWFGAYIIITDYKANQEIKKGGRYNDNY